MSGKKIGIIAGVVFILLIGFLIVGFVGMKYSYQNDEVELRNQAKAQQEANKIIYDKVWKVISQKAQITDKYEKAFKDIYVQIMDKRYADKNLLFKFVTEQNPNFSTEMYTQLSNAIEGNRAEFANVQMRLVDIKREHDNLRMKFPSSIFVGDRPELDIQIVTSTKTENVFKSGKDDDVKLFQ